MICTVAPTGTAPLKVGVVSWVMPSPLSWPVSLAASRRMVLKPVKRSPPLPLPEPLEPEALAVLPKGSRALAEMVPVGTGPAGMRLQAPVAPTVVEPMMLLSRSRTVTTAPGSPVPVMAWLVPPAPGWVLPT